MVSVSCILPSANGIASLAMAEMQNPALRSILPMQYASVGEYDRNYKVVKSNYLESA